MIDSTTKDAMSLIDHPLSVAKAAFRFEDDEAEFQAAIIHHDGALWLVATWLQPLAGGTPIPERLVPLAQLEAVFALPQGPYRLGRRIPRALFLRDAEPELLQRFGASQYPSIARTQGPASSH